MLELLNKFISSLEDKNKELDMQSGYDEARLEYICDDFLKYNAHSFIAIPSKKDLPYKETAMPITVEVSGNIKVERKFLQKGRSDILNGVGEFLARDLEYNLTYYYLHQLKVSFTIENRKLQFNNLDSELSSLDLTEEDCIIDIASNIQFKTKAKVFKIKTSEFPTEVFICKLADLPSLDIIDNVPVSTANKIDPYNYVYLAVEELPDKYNLSVIQIICINCISGKPKALRFTIEK